MSFLFLLFSGFAHAFCGAFVGAPGARLANQTSQVVYARDGGTTTLTLVADYSGDLSEFALVVPVPADLDPSRVRVVDPYLVDRLDRYSTPRLVRYRCDDAVTYTHGPFTAGAGCAMTLGCSADDALIEGLPTDVTYNGADGAVTVEAAFQVAEYDVVLLSATGAGGLYTWLGDNGYALPPGGDEVLQDYIDGGASFLAAKVRLDAVPAETSRLSPLQLAYESDVMGLPVRIGTISAQGEQEVLIYALNDASLGEMSIQNYREVELEDECMWPGDEHPSFTSFYRDALEGAREEVGGASWFVEYSWVLYYEFEVTGGGVKCDPCTVEVEELYDRGELAELGFVNGDAQLTRLRVSYGPDDVPEDLVLALREQDGNSQIRFVEYERQLEFLFPVCGRGYVEEPGQCGDDGTNAIQLGRSRSMVPPALLVVLGTFALAGLRRRS